MEKRLSSGKTFGLVLKRWLALFLDFFALESNKDCVISDRFDGQNWSWAWKCEIRSGRVLDQLDELTAILPTSFCNDVDDTWSWDCNNYNVFSVAQVRSYIEHNLLQTNDSRQTTWVALVPKKVNLFVWRLLRDCIPSFINLFARGIDTVTVRCLQCQDGIETTKHIFKNCYLVSETRNMVSNWIGFDVPVLTPIELMRWSSDLTLDRLKRDRIKAILYTWWWLTWKARNNYVHNSIRAKSREVFNELVAFTFLWITNRRKRHKVSWHDWIMNPIFSPG